MNPEPKSATETTLFRNRNYRFLLVADILSSPGYYIYIIAVEWLMLTLYDSRSYLGLMLFSSSFARLLFTIYGGIIADRLNRKLIILVTQWGEAFIIAAILLCYIADVISPVFLIVASFLFGILSAFASPAYESIITSIVEKAACKEAMLYCDWLINTVSSSDR
ncbi:MFS transporter [Paenibacillus larvae]|nr:MFS transporter [Paenibacillus larvae]MDT2238895.1 MFS transporter [Paenibacillus larvae]MDT2240847.1 MFS transporter [Paenibacillus larvae]MDT2302813.1 MFS transporter [Paenibacillus larvae]